MRQDMDWWGIGMALAVATIYGILAVGAVAALDATDAEGARLIGHLEEVQVLSPISPPLAYEPEAWELEGEEAKRAQRDHDLANDPEVGVLPVQVEPTPTIEPYQDTEEWCVVTIPLMGKGIFRCEEARAIWPTGQ